MLLTLASERLEPEICVYLFEKTRFMLGDEILDDVLFAHNRADF